MTISFLDKVRLKDEQIVEKYTTITLKKYNITGLEEIINEIRKLGGEGYYSRLVGIYLQYNKFYDVTVDFEKLSSIAKDGCKILGYQPINLPPFTRLLACQDLKTFYNFLSGIYVSCIGRQLDQEELGNILDNLDVFIMNNLDKFEQTREKSVITDEYFKKLRKIKWGKKSRELWLDINGLRGFAGFPPEKTPLRFLIEHDLLTQFLAACSAVNNDRDKIEQEDIVIAYKTYFKLLKADIPALVEKLEKFNEQNP